MIDLLLTFDLTNGNDSNLSTNGNSELPELRLFADIVVNIDSFADGRSIAVRSIVVLGSSIGIGSCAITSSLGSFRGWASSADRNSSLDR